MFSRWSTILWWTTVDKSHSLLTHAPGLHTHTRNTYQAEWQVWPCCRTRTRWTLCRFQKCNSSILLLWQGPQRSQSWVRSLPWPPKTVKSPVLGAKTRSRHWPPVCVHSRQCGTTWMWTWNSCGCHVDEQFSERTSSEEIPARRRVSCCPASMLSVWNRTSVCEAMICSEVCCWSKRDIQVQPYGRYRPESCPSSCTSLKATLPTDIWKSATKTRNCLWQ